MDSTIQKKITKGNNSDGFILENTETNNQMNLFNKRWDSGVKINMTKTSISHPLRIDEVKAPNGTGIIDMTLCPGKKIKSTKSGIWDRDLDMDLQAIQVWGAQALVNLMEEHEYELLRVPDYVA